MKIEVIREGGNILVKTYPADAGATVEMPIFAAGKLASMIEKAKVHVQYRASLECVEGRWKSAEDFELNAPGA